MNGHLARRRFPMGLLCRRSRGRENRTWNAGTPGFDPPLPGWPAPGEIRSGICRHCRRRQGLRRLAALQDLSSRLHAVSLARRWRTTRRSRQELSTAVHRAAIASFGAASALPRRGRSIDAVVATLHRPGVRTAHQLLTHRGLSYGARIAPPFGQLQCCSVGVAAQNSRRARAGGAGITLQAGTSRSLEGRIGKLPALRCISISCGYR
jgi:hypothetical protein